MRPIYLSKLNPLKPVKANDPSATQHSPRQWFIYGLTDPFTDELRYIGMSHCVIRRIIDHVGCAKRTQRTHKDRWVYSLWRDHKVKPNFVILESGTDPQAWKMAEITWIWLYREAGARLTNSRAGGDCPPIEIGRTPTPETRQRMSDAHKGKPGRPLSPEEVLRFTEWSRNRVVSQETREKISRIQKGRKQPQKTIDLRANALKGRKRVFSPEWRAAIAAGKRGKPRSPEAIAKFRATMTGRAGHPQTEETKEKIRQLKIAYYAQKRQKGTNQL